MMSYWAEFAAPAIRAAAATASCPLWTAWRNDGEKYAVLDTPAGGGMRMASESEELEDIAAAILARPELRDDAARCRALARLDEWTSERAAAVSYARAGDGRCAEAAVVPSRAGG